MNCLTKSWSRIRSRNAAARPATVISATWNQEPARRRVCMAQLEGERLVTPLAPPLPGHTLTSLLEVAREERTRTGGAVIVGINAALGVPDAYMRTARERPPWRKARSFLDLLATTRYGSAFFEECWEPRDWSIERPFFVPSPALHKIESFYEAAGSSAFFYRAVDCIAHAEPVFALSSAEVTLGSATREVWKDLAPWLRFPDRDFRIWPFEGSLAQLFADGQIIIAEISPHALRNVAVASQLPAYAPDLATTSQGSRKSMANGLRNARWVRQARIAIAGSEEVANDPSAFDALFSSAALARLALEGHFGSNPCADGFAEGGLLGLHLVDLAKVYTQRAREWRAGAAIDDALPATAELCRG